MTVQAPVQASPKPPPFQIVRTEPSEKYLKVLLYGDYGAGKTTLAATALDVPQMNDVLFINAESGDLSLPRGMDKVDVKSYETLARVFEFLRAHVRYRDAGDTKRMADLEARLRGEPVSTPKVYHTVIVDSLTEVQTYLMYQLLNLDIDNWALDVTPESPEYKEWGQSSEMIQLLVRTFRDLPMHVIFVCSAQEVSDDRNRLLKRPNLPGKLAGKVQGFLDVVGYLDTAPDKDGNVIRRLWMQPGTRLFQAKHRFRNHPDLKYIDNPTMDQLFNLTKESKTNASSTAAPSSNDTADAPAPSSSGSTARAGAPGGRTAGRPVQRGGRPVQSVRPVRGG